jgi:hypothetical protein
LQVDPANARVTAHLGRRLAYQAQGVDLEEAERSRAEADFLIRRQRIAPDSNEVKKLRDEEARRAGAEANFLVSRAQKLAPDSDEVKELRDEVVKLLELKTDRRNQNP